MVEEPFDSALHAFSDFLGQVPGIVCACSRSVQQRWLVDAAICGEAPGNSVAVDGNGTSVVRKYPIRTDRGRGEVVICILSVGIDIIPP